MWRFRSGIDDTHNSTLSRVKASNTNGFVLVTNGADGYETLAGDYLMWVLLVHTTFIGEWASQLTSG